MLWGWVIIIENNFHSHGNMRYSLPSHGSGNQLKCGNVTFVGINSFLEYIFITS